MNGIEKSWWTGDEDRLCLGEEDIAVLEGDLPAPRSPYEGMEPGEIGETGGMRE